MIGPIVDEIAGEYAGKANVFKMNVDENPAIPGQFGIRGIPTLLIFKNGQLVDQIVGAVPKDNLVAALKKHT
jgi:thioredoxin 1